MWSKCNVLCCFDIMAVMLCTRCVKKLNIFTEGKEVLFDGGSVTCRSFPSVVRSENAQLKPKDIQFTDNPQLDTLFSNITLVRLTYDALVSFLSLQ